MRRMLVTLMLLLVAFNTTAQDTDDYRLRRPTAEELLQAISESFELGGEGQDAGRMIEVELMTQHQNEMGQVNFDSVDQSYHLIYDQVYVSDAQVFWLQSRVVSWLTTNEIDLDEVKEFQFQELTVPVTAYDLNSDNQNEWILDLQENELQGYIVIRRDENEQYRVVTIPLPFELYEQRGYADDGVSKASWNISYVGDVNDDGLKEIVILYVYHYHEYENVGVRGRYYVLAWAQNSLIDIGAENLSFFLPNINTDWQWVQLDGDPALELRQVRDMRDNWDCFWEQTIIFDWEGNQYIKADVEEHYPETARCFFRLAEGAMWDGDYAQAITLYEQIERVGSNSHDFSMSDYPRIRLAIAHFLAGQMDEGIEILRTLESQPESFNSLHELTNTLLEAYAENPTAVGICLAAYDFFRLNPYYVSLEAYQEVGYTEDNIVFGYGMSMPRQPSPEKAGCDAPSIIDGLLTSHEFTTTVPPTQHLQTLGIPWNTVYEDDLNNDGVADWLVNISANNILPIFFVSEGEIYTLSRPDVAAPPELDEFNQLMTIRLPDDAGLALLRVSYIQPYVPPVIGYGLGGGPGECPASGRVSIWRFEQQSLTPIFSSLLCEQVELQLVVDDLPIVAKVYGWEFSYSAENYVPVEYAWDELSQTYTLTMESQATTTPSPVTSDMLPYRVYTGSELFLREAYNNIFEYEQQAQVALASDDLKLLEWHYTAGLSYEALGRDDEALAAYLAIIEAAPQSAWGMLAALHVQPVER